VGSARRTMVLVCSEADCVGVGVGVCARGVGGLSVCALPSDLGGGVFRGVAEPAVSVVLPFPFSEVVVSDQ